MLAILRGSGKEEFDTLLVGHSVHHDLRSLDLLYPPHLIRYQLVTRPRLINCRIEAINEEAESIVVVRLNAETQASTLPC